jgi:hypothetical protein
MPAATAIQKREEIIRCREAGIGFAHIARQVNLPYMTVRSVWQHYQRTGTVRPSYAACARTAVRKNPVIYQRAMALKQAHPTWGAGLIWVELLTEFEESQLPSERTLQRWFHRAGLVVQATQELGKAASVRRGHRPHEVWAMDAKEEMQLGDGSYASWLVISDEGSGAVLHTDLFPQQTLDIGSRCEGEDEHPERAGNMGTTTSDTG